MLGYPYQYEGLSGEWPCGSMVDWTTGELNQKYWGEILLLDTIGRPFRYCGTVVSGGGDLYAQGLSSAKGQVVVIINKLQSTQIVVLRGGKGKKAWLLEAAGGNAPARQFSLESDSLTLSAFATVFVSW